MHHHKLIFEERTWPVISFWKEFRVGTVTGLYRSDIDTGNLLILAVKNRCKGNGHFQEAIGYFEDAAKRDKVSVVFLEVWNLRLAWNLYKHSYKMENLFVWKKQF